MNILYLAHRIPFPPDKGDKLRSFRQLEYLARRHRVWCACFVDTSSDARFVDPLRGYCQDVLAISLHRGRAAIRGLAGLMRGRTLTESFYASPRMRDALRIWREAVKFDAVVAFSSSMASYALKVPAERHVLDMCDLDSEKWLAYAAVSRGPARWIYRMEGHRLALKELTWVDRFDATLLVTEAEAEVLKGTVDPRKIHVVRNGVSLPDLDRPRDRSPQSKDLVLCHERIDGCHGQTQRGHASPMVYGNHMPAPSAWAWHPSQIYRNNHDLEHVRITPEPRASARADTSHSEPRASARADLRKANRSNGVSRLSNALLKISDMCAPRLTRTNLSRPDKSLHRQASLARTTPTVGFVGMMNYRPNVDAVCWFVSECWGKIRARFPDAVFRIVGRSPARRVRRLASVAGVEVVGGVDDVTAEVRRFDVSVAPMRIARGVQNKVLEAMAAAKPVVLTGKAAEGIGAGHGKEFLVADQPEEIVESIFLLLCDHSLRERMGNSARQFVAEHHNWEESLRTFELIVTG